MYSACMFTVYIFTHRYTNTLYAMYMAFLYIILYIMIPLMSYIKQKILFILITLEKNVALSIHDSMYIGLLREKELIKVIISRDGHK